MEPTQPGILRLASSSSPRVGPGQSTVRVFGTYSLGPLDNEDTVASVRTFFNLATGATLRDPCSLELLDEAGIDTRHVTVTGDDALGLQSAPAADVDRSLRPDSSSPMNDDGVSPFIAFHVREADYGTRDREALVAWARTVEALANSAGWRVVGVSVNDQSGAPEAESFKRLQDEIGTSWHVVETVDDPRLLCGLLARAQAVVAHSYHVALFGLAADRPTVLASSGPYYLGKADGLRRLTGLSASFCVQEPPAPDELHDRLEIVRRELTARNGLHDASKAVDKWLAASMEKAVRAGECR